jgi:Cof subfamily protein (haloacid dehalogenase superfamily)
MALRIGVVAYRLLALDVDGTLLDPKGQLSPSTVEAVARAARAGMRIVLCTGRRYRRARPIASELGLDTPLVCNSGALVKEPSSHRTIRRAGFDAALFADLLDVFRVHDEPALSFTDRHPDEHDFLIARDWAGRPLFDDYVSQNREHAHVDPDWTDRIEEDVHFHICAVGTRSDMLAFEQAILARLGDRVRTFVQKSPRYAGTMCEVLRGDADKWTSVLHLAARWGIAPEEICAVGDDVNDVPMLHGAGLGVAMAHAAPEVQAAADRVLAEGDPNGLVTLIDELLG